MPKLKVSRKLNFFNNMYKNNDVGYDFKVLIEYCAMWQSLIMTHDLAAHLRLINSMRNFYTHFKN